MTVQSLRKRTNFFMRLLCFPLLSLLVCLFFALPLVVKVIVSPTSILSLRGIADWLLYMIQTVLSVSIGILCLAFYFVPPSIFCDTAGEGYASRQFFYRYWGDKMKERKIQFDVVKEVETPCYF